MYTLFTATEQADFEVNRFEDGVKLIAKHLNFIFGNEEETKEVNLVDFRPIFVVCKKIHEFQPEILTTGYYQDAEVSDIKDRILTEEIDNYLTDMFNYLTDGVVTIDSFQEDINDLNGVRETLLDGKLKRTIDALIDAYRNMEFIYYSDDDKTNDSYMEIQVSIDIHIVDKGKLGKIEDPENLKEILSSLMDETEGIPVAATGDNREVFELL